MAAATVISAFRAEAAPARAPRHDFLPSKRPPTAHRRRSVVALSEQAAAAAGAPPPTPPLVAGPEQQQLLLTLGRRSTLLMALQAASALVALPPAAAEEATVTVGAGKDYATITEALQHTPSGGTVQVFGGRYTERLIITQPVTIAAAPEEAVEVAWATSQPYQATIECNGVQGGAVVLRGLRVRHSSPSIANNYAVKLMDCTAVLADCDISSSTGDGIGIEGGSPQIQRCSMHQCARHGVAVFGDLFGGGCQAVLDQCSMSDNRMSGLLVRDGATPTVTDCSVSGNAEWGLKLQDAGGVYTGNEIVANSKGSVAYSLLFEEVDTARMVVDNYLDRPVHSLGRV